MFSFSLLLMHSQFYVHLDSSNAILIVFIVQGFLCPHCKGKTAKLFNTDISSYHQSLPPLPFKSFTLDGLVRRPAGESACCQRLKI